MLKSNETADLFMFALLHGKWINRGIGRKYIACGVTV